jgi:hypothetical protein
VRPRGGGHRDGVRPGARAQALRSPRGANPGGQSAGSEAGPLVGRGPLAGQRAQRGLVLGVARVQGAQVGGHPPAPADGSGEVVDGRLHDAVVQTGLGRPAAQGVGEVAACFGKEMVAREGAAHHVHHSDDAHGRQGNVDHRPRPRPHGELVDDVGAERPDRRGSPASRRSVSDSSTVRFGGRVWSAAWRASA